MADLFSHVPRRLPITARAVARLAYGHLWVFSNEVTGDLRTFESGEAVTLIDPRGRGVAAAYVNPGALIAARVVGAPEEQLDERLLASRMADAVRYRANVLDDARFGRCVFGESDRLPGLVVDRYDDVAVVQVLTAGISRLEDEVVEAVRDAAGTTTVVLANDSPFRSLEGLPLSRRVACGESAPRARVEERDLVFEVDVLRGQKTGFFYDQRDNRRRFGERLGGEARVLDLFTYTGAFALEAARRGADVTARDRSAEALAIARRNAIVNGLASRVSFEQVELIEGGQVPVAELRAFDAVVLDPPPLARNRRTKASAQRAMARLCRDAVMRLSSDGLLVACTCSHHLTRDDLLDAIAVGAARADREVRVTHVGQQAADHPVRPSMPETAYLHAAFVDVT